MTSSLRWEPVRTADDAKTLSTELKFALRKRHGEPVNRIFNIEDVRYLEGLRDGGLKSAQELLDAIEKFGPVEVTEAY